MTHRDEGVSRIFHMLFIGAAILLAIGFVAGVIVGVTIA